MFVCSECGQDHPAGGRCPVDGAELVDSRSDPLLGQMVGSYRVVGRIGVGGMGAVYKAVHPKIGSRVAIKVLGGELSGREGAVGDESVKRFFAEARAVNLVHHEGIVSVLDLGELPGGVPYMLMELLEGETLADLIEKRAPLPIGEVLAILGQVLDALGAAHRAGIIHRDIKPHNVFVTTTGRAKLLDFGVAKLRAPDADGGSFNQLLSIVTAAGALVGTPYYCSPEQALGLPVDARSDLYAVGVVAFEALTGKVPFDAEGVLELLRMHIDEPPPHPRRLRPELSVELERVILRALAKEPDERFRDASEMLAHLRRAAEAEAAPSLPMTTHPEPPPFSVIDGPFPTDRSPGAPPPPLSTAQSSVPVVIVDAGISVSGRGLLETPRGAAPSGDPLRAKGLLETPRATDPPHRSRAVWIIALAVVVIVGSAIAIWAILAAQRPRDERRKQASASVAPLTATRRSRSRRAR
jgi:serine/threonine protein kinase